MNNRIVKENVMNGTKEIYIRDAQGNVIAVYEVSKKNNVDSLFSKEFHIFGSNRLGYLMDRKYIARKTYGKTFGGAIPALPVNPIISIPNPFILPGATTVTPLYFGNKRYELADWLGNVRVVINDKKTPVNSGTTTVSYLPQVVNVRDYYSFGSQISERSYDPVKPMYRFGFNTQEKVNEITQDHYTAKFWEYDARLGRRWNLDPVDVSFLSRYAVNQNNPLRYFDPFGNEKEDKILHDINTGISTYVEDEFGKDLITHHYGEWVDGGTAFKEYGMSLDEDLPIGDAAKNNIPNTLPSDKFNFNTPEGVGKFKTGLFNFGFGAAGTVSGIVYSTETAGVGMTIGGSMLITSSLGQAALGITQMVEGMQLLLRNKSNFISPDASTIQGAIVEQYANQTGNKQLKKYVPIIDVGSSWGLEAGTSIIKNGLIDGTRKLFFDIGNPLNAYSKLEDIKQLNKSINDIKEQK